MSIVTTYNLMCDVCKKRIDTPPYKLQHIYSGVDILAQFFPEGWTRINNKFHVCSNECFAAHSAAQKLYGEDYLNNPSCGFSW